MLQRVPEIGVLSHAVAVATNRDDVAMVDEPINERDRHHLVAKDLAPLLEAFVGRQDGCGVACSDGILTWNARRSRSPRPPPLLASSRRNWSVSSIFLRRKLA